MSRGRFALSIVLAIAGVAVIAYFLHTTRLADVRDALGRLAVWIPLLIALEGARIAVEAAGTRALYQPYELPIGLLLRSHVIGYSLAFYMPAGRASAEAVKAAMLAKCATPARAAAVAAANQSLALLGLAIAAIACLVGAALIPATSRLVASLAVVAAVTGALAIVIRVATLRMRGGWLLRFAPKIATIVDDARCEVPRWLPLFPLAMFVVNRGLQLVSIAILLHALSGDVTLVSTLAVGGVNLVGASLGDMVPGQLGATDATFSVSARLVGLTTAAALSIALMIHIIQMTWMAIGIVTELGLRIAATVQRKRVL